MTVDRKLTAALGPHRFGFIADWPGLKPADLYEDRDLKATTDLRAVLKGLLRDHLRADERALAEIVFPGSADVKPMAGLVA